MATVFGFRGGRWTSIEALARGETDASTDRQAGMDRYATSKLLAMATSVELARRMPEVCSVVLDPGMLPGTGLVRSAPWYARLVWSTVLRALVPLLPDASTPARSAAIARRLVVSDAVASGEVYDFTGAPSPRVASAVRDPAFGSRVVEESLAFLQAHRG
jgi:protochlorophyllide reductase